MLRAGLFRIDLEAERLWHGADAIPLRPKTWAVLRHLVEAGGRVVTKQELLDRVWVDTAVEEKTLNTSIAEIRQAFGDSAREPHYVETVHRRGFRFVAALAPADADPTTAIDACAPPRPSCPERSPFLGRDSELARLRTMRAALQRGRGAIVTLTGPAGTGKSRLVRELLAEGAVDDGVVLAGRCFQGAGVPYWPWVEMLRVYMRAIGPDAVRAACGDGAAELSRIVPGLGQGGGSVPPAHTDSELARLLLFDALGRFLEGVVPGRSLVVVIEDLHWADASSLHVLQALAPRIAARPALLVVTLRDDEVGTDPRLRAVVAGLAREAMGETMRLQGLSEAAARALVHALGGDQTPAPVVDRIVAVSEGNPFFIEETVRHLSDLALFDRGIGWRSQLLGQGLDLPASVSDVFERRLRRLSPECRQLVDVAAVIGTEVDEWLMGEAGELEEEALIALLGEAMDAGILQEVAARPGRYRFGHALMRFTVYKLLSGPLRRRLHRRVAEAIEAVHGDQGDALAALALHLCRAVPAVPAARAIDVALLAAEQARAQLAYESEAELPEGEPGDEPQAARFSLPGTSPFRSPRRTLRRPSGLSPP
jgi:predicted ATPase/DNA-binding winged helix-turn-helix (wHTH) protein